MSYKTAIHDLLVTTAAAGTFTQAIYSVERPSLLTAGDPILPQSVEANEIRGAFVVDNRHGRDYRQDRAGWAWLLRLRFGVEANLEEFETTLMENPLFVARDVPTGVFRQVMMILEESEYEHPPRGGASNGTQATYRFVAEICPQ